MGGAYLRGNPIRSIYQYELLVRLSKEVGFYLAQEFYHYNPSRLPSPAEWVTIRRIRVKDSVNSVWWLSKTPHPARFFRVFAEFYIKFLTDENDTVLDLFAGSNTTGFVAETLQRRWLSFEIDENYLIGSKYRFNDEEID